MANTKEQILMTALRLFAQDGFEAVSVSAIAGELGITKGALYKHYESKQDIFDHIVARMFQIDAERARAHAVQEQTFDADPDPYRQCDFDHIKAFTMAQFSFWTEDPFASNFRKMLSLERYRNPNMGKLYRDCLTEGPVSYMEDIFRQMTAAGILADQDPKQLALQFYSPMYLLIEMWDTAEDPALLPGLLQTHIDSFIRAHAV